MSAVLQDPELRAEVTEKLIKAVLVSQSANIAVELLGWSMETTCREAIEALIELHDVEPTNFFSSGMSSRLYTIAKQLHAGARAEAIALAQCGGAR